MQSDHVHHPNVTDQSMTLNSDSPSRPCEPLPLHLQKLPVRIPLIVGLKYPSEWYLNDGGPPADNPTPYDHICGMMDCPRPFTPLCRMVLAHLVFSLFDNWTIDCDGVSVSIHGFMRIIKFGRKSDPSLREVALGLVRLPNVVI